ncbi:hypothetical protein ACJX0J_016557, partial [Zea mays]
MFGFTQRKKIIWNFINKNKPGGEQMDSGTRIYNKRDFKYELMKQKILSLLQDDHVIQGEDNINANVDMARLGEEDKSFLTSFSIHEIHNVVKLPQGKILHEKAYDKVNWQFLHQMIDQKGFGEKW